MSRRKESLPTRDSGKQQGKLRQDDQVEEGKKGEGEDT